MDGGHRMGVYEVVELRDLAEPLESEDHRPLGFGHVSSVQACASRTEERRGNGPAGPSVRKTSSKVRLSPVFVSPDAVVKKKTSPTRNCPKSVTRH